jgi:hypothetical protein
MHPDESRRFMNGAGGNGAGETVILLKSSFGSELALELMPQGFRHCIRKHFENAVECNAELLGIRRLRPIRCQFIFQLQMRFTSPIGTSPVDEPPRECRWHICGVVMCPTKPKRATFIELLTWISRGWENWPAKLSVTRRLNVKSFVGHKILRQFVVADLWGRGMGVRAEIQISGRG